ncbi:MAG: hypothetical protein AMXMBFR58_29090 [Phycisphaerae bacterium]|nr:hypothetical protein [Phycisphaerales bacterium]
MVRAGLIGLGLAAAGTLPGCYSQPGPPEPAEGQFEQGVISIDSTGREHVIVARVGSPGYSLTMDSTWEAYRRKHVFVTLHDPDPRFSYPQVVVDLRVLTQVSTREAITVFARRAGRDEEDIEAPYQEAAAAPGSAATSGVTPAEGR